MQEISKTLASWASILDEKTLEQARTTATMPFIYPHLALMPDAHLGPGATVGARVLLPLCRQAVDWSQSNYLPVGVIS